MELTVELAGKKVILVFKDDGSDVMRLSLSREDAEKLACQIMSLS